MTITATQIDELHEEMQKFGKDNFGQKNGEDFLQIARSFIQSKTGSGQLKAAVALGMLGMLIAQPKEGEPKDDRIERIMGEDNPFKEFLADVFYLGYRLGKIAAEVDKLESTL